LNVVLGELSSPELLLLDEPYQGFDHGGYVDLWDHIDHWRDTGTAVLIVSHMLSELDRVDRVVELDAPEE
jgi:ABC-type multidrug transport system ATPase subunit